MKIIINESQLRLIVENENKGENLIDFTGVYESGVSPNKWDDIFLLLKEKKERKGDKTYDGYYIEGDVELRKLYLTELFDLSDVEVKGYFNCMYNHLTNLKGAPHTVGKYFNCIDNNLISLEGAPHTVNGNFYCSYNHLISLAGAPLTVGMDFWCDLNNLTSLKGAPHTVGGSFYCSGNNLTSLEGIPKTVNGNFFIDEVLEDKFPERYIRRLCKIKGDVVYI